MGDDRGVVICGLWPDIDPHPSVGHINPVDRPRPRFAGQTVGDHQIDRQSELGLRLGDRLEQARSELHIGL